MLPPSRSLPDNRTPHWWPLIILPHYHMSSNLSKMSYFSRSHLSYHSQDMSFQWCFLLLRNSQQTELPTDDSPTNDNLASILYAIKLLKMLYFHTFDNPNLPFQWCFLILWNSHQTELPRDDSPTNDNLPYYFLSSNYCKCCTVVLLIITTCPFSDASSYYETPSKQNSPLMTVQLMTILPLYLMSSNYWKCSTFVLLTIPGLSVMLPHPMKLPANRTPHWWQSSQWQSPACHSQPTELPADDRPTNDNLAPIH